MGLTPKAPNWRENNAIEPVFRKATKITTRKRSRDESDDSTEDICLSLQIHCRMPTSVDRLSSALGRAAINPTITAPVFSNKRARISESKPDYNPFASGASKKDNLQ